jgi:hypothetical protein
MTAADIDPNCWCFLLDPASEATPETGHERDLELIGASFQRHNLHLHCRYFRSDGRQPGARPRSSPRQSGSAPPSAGTVSSARRASSSQWRRASRYRTSAYSPARSRRSVRPVGRRPASRPARPRLRARKPGRQSSPPRRGCRRHPAPEGPEMDEAHGAEARARSAAI